MLLNLRSPALFKQIKILSRFVFIQLGLQVLGVISGVLIVRTMNPTQYAYFTIANSMQSTMNLLSDMGLGSALLSIGGRVWRDQYRFSQLINSAMSIRRYLAGIAILVTTPILIWLLVRNGASLLETILIVGIVICEFNLRIIITIFYDVLRLRSKIDYIQSADSFYTICRFGVLIIATSFQINSVFAVFASLVGSALQRVYIGKLGNEGIDVNASPKEEDKREIIARIKSQFAYYTFFIFQGQLTIGLISLFGNTQKIAEVGALGRLGILISIIGSVVSQIGAPGFARRQTRKALFQYYTLIIGTVTLLALLMVILSSSYPLLLLWILGSKYYHLRNEVSLIALGSMVTLIYSSMWSLNVAKGWIQYSWIIIPATLLTQCIAITYLDISTVNGVIVFNIFSTVPSVIVNIYMSYLGFRRMREDESSYK